MQTIQAPIRDSHDMAKLKAAVQALEALWEARKKRVNISADRLGRLVDELKLESKEARIRCLAYKLPE